MHDIKIRPAQLEDLPTLYRFEQGIISAERPFDPTLKPDPINYYDLKELILSPEAQVLIASSKGKLVGSGYALIKSGKVYHRHNRYTYLGFMYVEPEFRGRGVVSLIINELHKWSRNQGIDEVRLEVYDQNSPAIKAYEKLGFKKHMIEMRLDNKE